MLRLRVLKHRIERRPACWWYVAGRKRFCWRTSPAMRASLGLGDYAR